MNDLIETLKGIFSKRGEDKPDSFWQSLPEAWYGQEDLLKIAVEQEMED